MNDRIKAYIHKNFIDIMFFALCAVLVLMFCFCFRANKPTSTNSNVGTTIQKIEQDIDGAGDKIKQTQAANREARESIERADFAIRNSTERARELQTEVRIISAELSRIIELNRLAQEQLEQAKNASK